jgi:hypothetical protein
MRGRLDLPNPFRRDRAWFWAEADRLGTPGFYSSDIERASEASQLLTGRPADAPGITRGRDPQLERAHDELMSRRYTVIQELIPPVQLMAIRQYYRALISEGFVQFADQDWPDRYFAKRDSLAYCFHQQLTPVVSKIAGEPVKPSFAFLTSYRPGAILHPHKDRAQCHYSLSILLDHTPEPADVSPWPIFVQPPGASEATPVRIALGDALMYFGEEVLHYRDALPVGQSSTLWFFFYVPIDFEGSLD